MTSHDEGMAGLSVRCPTNEEHVFRIQKAARLLAQRVPRIASRWTEHYAGAFGARGYFSARSFAPFAEDEVSQLVRVLDAGELRLISSFFSERARAAGALGIPFDEVCRSIHLLEESVVEILLEDGRTAAETLELYLTLDYLSHERMIHIVEAYQDLLEERWSCRQGEVIERVSRLEQTLGERNRLCDLVGASLPMQRVYEDLLLASRSREPVLLTGASGTGKELAARAVHALSGDPADRFVAVNCAALSDGLIESELFGHQQGAFSGAVTDYPGLMRASAGGTLFLDEITELSPPNQAKLLRALQEHAVRPVGGLSEIHVDTRIIASTNRDVGQALEEGCFRSDLYYRLQELIIQMPLLSERGRDVPLLVEHFIDQARTDGLRVPSRGVSQAAMDALCAHSWPGNVRELRSVVRISGQRCDGEYIQVEHLPEGTRRAALDIDDPAGGGQAPGSPLSMEAAEYEAVSRAMTLTRGNKSQAARMLGISRKLLYAKLRRHGIGS